MNTLGSKRMLELAIKTKNLKRFVQVSSLYAHANRTDIDEKIYKPVNNVDAIINFTQNFSDDTVKQIEKKLIENQPNTYTYSKALAEWVLKTYSDKIPISIVRPTLVTGAWKEPSMGYVDNLYTANGMLCAMAIGLFRSFPTKTKTGFDLIPVDILANAIIAAPWHSTYHMNEKLPIYNCASQAINPLDLEGFRACSIQSARKYPTKHMCGYPRHPSNGNFKAKFMNKVIELPESYFNDFILKLRGKKPMCVKFSQALATLDDVTKIEYKIDFHSDNFKKMIEDLKKIKESKEFDVDFKGSNGFNWQTYMDNLLLGIRSNILKEDVEKHDYSKLRKMYWWDIGSKSTIIIAISTGIYQLIV